jgi:hypothetical protein
LQGVLKPSILSLLLVILTACASTTPPVNGKQVPAPKDSNRINQLAKGDVDRMADIELRENTQSLRLLMIKLYKRNPHELKKSTSGTAEEMVDWVFEGDQHWKFESIQKLQDVEAIKLAFKPDYDGDRVLPLIVGLQTMLLKAHDNKTEFYLTDSLDPQKIYNVSRNIEIAAWKLYNTRDEKGQLYLLSNEMTDNERNLSFEREFGKIIGRTDDYAILLAEKAQRSISKVTQSLATAVFLPF